MHMKATASEEHIAKVSEIKNAWNASFFAMIGRRVFNSGMKKKSAITDKVEISGILEFFIFIFIFYVYFLNLFFSETNIQKINFGW